MTAGPSDERRADLERRLAEVRAELADVSKERLGYTASYFDPLREKSEALEAEADALRSELGLPAARGRPPRADGVGWALVCGSAVAIVILLWLVPR